MKRSSHKGALWSALLGLALLTGCEATVESILPTERAYTLYGYLDALADTQAVRVFAIDPVLTLTPNEALDATMTATRLSTGEVTAWQDSLVRYPNGHYGHVFWSAFTPAFGETVQLDVTRSDGVRSRVTTQVPPDVTPRLLEPEVTGIDVRLPVAWDGAPRLIDLEMRYEVQIILDGDTPVDTLSITIPYDGNQRQAPGGWVVSVDLSADINEIVSVSFREGNTLFNTSFGIVEMELQVLVGDAAWAPPGGAFDAEVLVEPGTFTNVENGFGFVGSGYTRTLNWLPDPDVLRQAGFTVL